MVLIYFELIKVWKKKSFILAVCGLLLIHIFLLWYTSLSDGETPPLYSYKEINAKLSCMEEDEKGRYIEGLKEKIDGVCFARDIIAIRGFAGEMGNILAEEEMRQNPGIFEKYYDIYISDDYLEYTDSLEQEKYLIDEIYEQYKTVSEYGGYLNSIQENKNMLSGISIFGGQNKDSFSFRNLQRSAADYAKLTDDNVRFVTSKSITSSMQCPWTEILLFLLIMLSVGILFTEEKEKKLFLITRSTKYGILNSILAKMAAILIHCIAVTAIFYLGSLTFFWNLGGGFDLGAGIQSVAAYTESCFSISILEYIVFSILTKAAVLFGIAMLLASFCITSKISVMPFLSGTLIMGISVLLYVLIPSGSLFSIFKYLNPAGLTKTENLYGRYLNFNLFGYPVSRLNLSLIMILLLIALGGAGSIMLFCRMKKLETGKLRLPFSIPFKPHTSVCRHEIYKFLITNRGLAVLALFACLLGIKGFEQNYNPSVMEQYYRDIMMNLEGEMTEEKEKLVLSEEKRYTEAFLQLERINETAGSTGMSSGAKEALKADANMTVYFYPAFCRIWNQYQYIKENGGSFVYDTGYTYWFGAAEKVFAVDFLILSFGIIIAVSGCISIEYKTGMYFLLCASKAGKRRLFVQKFIICAAAASLLTLVPVLCRFINIASVYPMHKFNAAVQNIACLSDFALPVSIGVFVLLFVFSQIAAAVLITLVTFAISFWRKNQAQTVFFALLILTVPIILNQLGFEIAKYFSLYPLYGWTELF